VVVDIKQHKSQFNISNFTITQSAKLFRHCVMVMFELLNCDSCCLVRPKTIVFGRTYVLLWFFFFSFFPRVISELRRPIGAKFCTMLGAALNFIITVQNFGGAKNMQNLARFRSTSKFGGKYLRNRWRYSKLVSYSFDSDSSCIRRNKSGEDRSSNLGDLDVSLYPLKAHFSEYHISAPMGCCAPNFYTC